MEKYRLISRWTSDYYPRGYRQDGQPQERVESINLFSEEEAKYAMEYFNKHLADGAWIVDRYEIDDGKYVCYELIPPDHTSVVKIEDIASEIKTEDTPEVKPEEITEAKTEEVLELKSEEPIEPKVEDKPKKKRKKIQGIEILTPVIPTETTKLEEISSPTKTIYVVKYIATQTNLDPSVQKINGRIPPEERAKIYNNFNDNFIEKISITEAVVRLGGVRYNENGKEINVEFLDDIDYSTREFILSKINNKI